jgi:hypothetical protein
MSAAGQAETNSPIQQAVHFALGNGMSDLGQSETKN